MKSQSPPPPTEQGQSNSSPIPPLLFFLRVLIADRMSIDNDESSSQVISPMSPGPVPSEKAYSDLWDDIERRLLGE